MRDQGVTASTASIEGTVRTNTELVPARARQLLDFARELGDLDSLEGLSVLEAGCGFGALATYLALTQGTDRVVGIDLRPDLIQSAIRATDEMGASQPSFSVDDMRELRSIGDEAFDVAFVNNAMLYITDSEGVPRAAASLHRVLRPGGRVVVFQANRWRLRDPFHGTPIVHLLPRPLRRPLDRRLGRPDEASRIKLLSPGELSRFLRTAGFTDVRVGTYAHGHVDRRSLARFSNWIAVVAQKPRAN